MSSAALQALRKGLTLLHRVLHIPILSDCHKYFHVRRFYVVGSGMIGNESRLFIIAQRRVDTPVNIRLPPSLRKLLSRCLVEITFNSNYHDKSGDLQLEIWCCNQDKIRFFLSALDLKELFGELQQVVL